MSLTMASSGYHGAAKAEDLRLLLPFSRETLRIPEELAKQIDTGEAFVVGPFNKIWPIDLERDGNGAFLGRGWPEFADACGVGEGWRLLLRHCSHGVLSVKAFDATFCLKQLGPPPSAGSINAPHKPQFIRVLPQDFMKNMLIPAQFVEHYIPKEYLNNHRAIITGPNGKIDNIELEMNEPHVFLAGGWSQFLAFHGIKKDNTLLFRYDGHVMFKVKVFGPDGLQRESKYGDISMEQGLLEEHQKFKSKNVSPTGEGRKEPNSLMSFNKAPLRRKSYYEIGPQSWIMKEINTYTLEKKLSLAKGFCDAIGLREPCTITLKTSIDSTRSWQVRGHPSNKSSYLLGHGWRRFCQENSLKEGDTCTFNIIENTLWHVAIIRYMETPCASSRKRNIEGQKRPAGSMNSLNKASSKKKHIFAIGPPAWIRKEINTSTIGRRLYLSSVFCQKIGLLEPCTITLKTSMSSTRSWQVRVVPYKNSSHQVSGSGWRRFYLENGIKVGDVCTFNIVETTVWHAIITPSIS